MCLIHTATGLHQCKAIIAVITSKYIASEYCDMELCQVQGKGKEIFPVIYEKVDFKASEQAQAVDMMISRYQFTFFRPGEDDYTTSLGQLVTGLKKKGLGAQQEE